MSARPPRASALLLGACALLFGACGEEELPRPTRDPRPNIILVLADDLGYGDLGVYGATTTSTPRIDALARSGARLDRFYVGNSVCTPSRATLLTGRHGPRQVLADTLAGVYWPGSRGGMAHAQITIAEMLRDAGYRTAMIGKWHLGQPSEYLPTQQGFDHFYGIPYSNDMRPLPLLRQQEVLRADLSDEAGLTELASLWRAELISYIEQAATRREPFFLYHPTHLPHAPLHPGAGFAGLSPSCEALGAEQACGAYADVILELDDTVGAIQDALARTGLAENTLVIVTSDNGPWLREGRGGGSAGPLRQGKASTFEGGYVVPAVVAWPARIGAGRVITEPAMMVDWLPTFAAIGGATVPPRNIDGLDLVPLLTATGPRDPSGEDFIFPYYRLDNSTPGALRHGRWKYKVPVVGGEAVYLSYDHGELLFDLETDPGETTDLASTHPDRVMSLRAELRALDEALHRDPNR